MDFFESNRILDEMSGLDKSIKLELLNVNESSLRKKGVASYYLNKLIEFAETKRIKVIRVSANNEANIFKGENKDNRLSMEELKKFYKRHSTKKVEIKLI